MRSTSVRPEKGTISGTISVVDNKKDKTELKAIDVNNFFFFNGRASFQLFKKGHGVTKKG